MSINITSGIQNRPVTMLVLDGQHHKMASLKYASKPAWSGYYSRKVAYQASKLFKFNMSLAHAPCLGLHPYVLEVSQEIIDIICASHSCECSWF